jgi:four helix bundle protein
MANYRELKVWQLGIEVATDVYRLTRDFPPDERFGLIAQMRRSAVSISSNIAEGHARNANQEMIRFCSIALGSVAELETQLVIAQELEFGDNDAASNLQHSLDELSRMLHSLIRSFRDRQRARDL